MPPRKKISDYAIKKLLDEGYTQVAIAKKYGVSPAAISARMRKLYPKEAKCLKELSSKERDFVIAVTNGQDRTEAAMQIYNTANRTSASNLQSVLMRKPEIMMAIEELMELKGIGRGYRVDKLKEHLENSDPVISLKSLDMAFKLADDAGERKKDDKYNPCSDIDIIYYRNIASIIRIPDRCSICETKTKNDFCKDCMRKYPDLIARVKKHWSGDRCIVCEDDRRCYTFCKACKWRPKDE